MKKRIKDAKTFAQEKALYIEPQCTVIPMEEERYLCLTSVVPGHNPKEEDWSEEDEDIDGGDNDIDL